MNIQLNGQSTDCFIEKVFTLTATELHHILTSGDLDVLKHYGRDSVYEDTAGRKHCVLIFGDSTFARISDIALVHAPQRTGAVQVSRLSAANFTVDSGKIELDHLIIMIRAITEYLLERMKHLPEGKNLVVTFHEIRELFDVDLFVNKDLALIVGEVLLSHNMRAHTDLSGGRILIQGKEDGE